MLISPVALWGQAEPTVLMTPRNSFTVALDYAPTSQHLFLGRNDQRSLADISVGYRRKLTSNEYMQWSWMVEAQPFILMTEPVQQFSVQFNGGPTILSESTRVLHCTPSSVTFTATPPGGTPIQTVATTHCGRITDYGTGLSPIGQHFRFLPFSRVGPFVDLNGGFLIFNRSIPSDLGRSFNFQFVGGVGIEFALKPRDRRKMLAVEYRANHISNANTAPDNSGIDQQTVRVTYIFGR